VERNIEDQSKRVEMDDDRKQDVSWVMHEKRGEKQVLPGKGNQRKARARTVRESGWGKKTGGRSRGKKD